MDSAHSHASHEAHNDVRTLLSWKAPGRPFKRKTRHFYLSVALLVFFIMAILFLFKQYELMLVTIALTFLSCSLTLIPPHDFHYKITTQGIKVEDYFYIWHELYDFYFKRIEGADVLVVRTQDLIPGELKISMGDLTREHIRKVLVPYLPYREYIHPTFMERSSDWLAANFPMEKS